MVEIIPRPPERVPFWQNLIILVAIAILIIVIFGYFILGSLQKKADQQLGELKNKIAQTETLERKELKTNLLIKKKKIDDFSLIMNKHRLASPFFLFIEKVTHPKVWFSDINLDLTKGSIGLSGSTENFITLGQQVTILKTIDESIKGIIGQKIFEVDLSKISTEKGGKVGFTINLFLNPKVLR